MLMMLMENLI